MHFANQHWFDRPDALLEARGAARTGPIAAADGSLDWNNNGGILAPVRAELDAGTRLVRFGRILPWLSIAGGWWLEWSAYRRVEAFADRYRLPVQVALRLLCCIPPEWSELNVVIEARTIAALLAYRGPGAPVRVTNKASGQMSFMAATADAAGEMVPQLFIPGMGSPDLRRDAILLTGHGLIPAETRFRVA